MSAIVPQQFFAGVDRSCDILWELHSLIVWLLFTPTRLESLSPKITEEDRKLYTIFFQLEVDEVAREAIEYLSRFKLLHDRLVQYDHKNVRQELEEFCQKGERFFTKARKIEQKQSKLDQHLGRTRIRTLNTHKEELMNKVNRAITLSSDLRNKILKIDISLFQKPSSWWEWIGGWFKRSI